jgi:hypothetical protein
MYKGIPRAVIILKAFGVLSTNDLLSTTGTLHGHTTVLFTLIYKETVADVIFAS